MKVKWQMAWLYLNEFWEASIVLGMEKVTTLLLLKLLVLMTSLSAAIFMSSVTSSVGVAVWIDSSSSEAKGGPFKKDQIPKFGFTFRTNFCKCKYAYQCALAK